MQTQGMVAGALQERGLDPWESGIQAVSARCVLREHIAPLLRAKIVSSGGVKPGTLSETPSG